MFDPVELMGEINRVVDYLLYSNPEKRKLRTKEVSKEEMLMAL